MPPDNAKRRRNDLAVKRPWREHDRIVYVQTEATCRVHALDVRAANGRTLCGRPPFVKCFPGGLIMCGICEAALARRADQVKP
jgi:hypothetical protein